MIRMLLKASADKIDLPCDGACSLDESTCFFLPVSNSRFDFPSLLVSIRMSGSIRISRLKRIIFLKRGSTANLISSRLILASSGRDPHDTFWKLTSFITKVGVKPNLSSRSPPSKSSRPVVSLTIRVICGFKLLKS